MELAKLFDDLSQTTDTLFYNDELMSIFDALPFYVILVDEEHKIVFANTAVEKQFDSKPGEIVGKYCPNVIHDATSPIPECPLDESISTGRNVEYEVYDTKKDMWRSSAVYPTKLRTRNGKKVYFHIVEDITRRKKAEEKAKQSLNKLKRITNQGICAISRLIESRDPYTALHQAKVGSIAYMIAKDLGYSDEEADLIQVAGLLHDVGKSAVPIEILYKPGKLTNYEFEQIKSHCLMSYEILKDMEFDIPVGEIALQHHERLDGSGYPRGLKGDEILKETMIISVADVLDAMTSHRPYRPKRSMEEAVFELESNAGVLYDADIVKAAVKLCSAGEIQPESLCFKE